MNLRKLKNRSDTSVSSLQERVTQQLRGRYDHRSSVGQLKLFLPILRRSGLEAVDIALSAAGGIGVAVLVDQRWTLFGISIFAGVSTISVLLVLRRLHRESAEKQLVRLLPKGLDWTVKLIGGAMVGSALKLASQDLGAGILLLALDCFLLLLTVDLVKPTGI